MSHMLIQGDARHIPLADNSVHVCITSPPYYGLRDYQTARWEGGDEGCDHSPLVVPRTERPRNGLTGGMEYCRAKDPVYRDVCGKCGARRVDAQIGLEPTPGDFVAEMVRVFREVRRVLRNDGCLWLNIGDSYASGEIGRHDAMESGHSGHIANRKAFGADKHVGRARQTRRTSTGLKPKDLIGIPWRVAFALQADGWYLRSDIIWAKPNPMPESVADRPTKSHEYLFLLSKSERYFWDADAVREVGAGRLDRGHSVRGRIGQQGWRAEPLDESAGRNLRSVWTIPTESFIGAHFATFPRRLVEPCIRAGTSGRGVCPACSAPWVREVEVDYVKSPVHGNGSVVGRHYATGANNFDGAGMPRLNKKVSTTGWRPSCPCAAGEPVPATVFDPFIGSGTTIVVAEALGRRGVGLDLSRDYLGLARRRIERPHARIPRPQSAGPSLPLFPER